MSVDSIRAEIDGQISAHATYESYRDGADRLSHKLAYRVLTVLGIEAEPDVVDEVRAEIRSSLERKASDEGWDEDEDEAQDIVRANLRLIKGDK